MTDRPNVRMSLASRPDHVALVREALAGLAHAVELGDAVEDIKAAVSEAANNVVMHAYRGAEGPMVVELALGQHEICAVVRDFGVGIGPRLVGPGDAGPRIGLAVIEALASTVELRARDGGPGVEIAMWFPIREPRRLPGLERPFGEAGEWSLDATGVQVEIAPAEICAPIVVRVLTALAARAGFSIDRLSDLQLVADALAANLRPALDGADLTVTASGGRRSLELDLGPLRAGGSRGMVAGSAVADLGPIIERLVDRVDVRKDGLREHLALVISDGVTADRPRSS